MPRGGRRNGAGRPAGSKSQRTVARARVEQVAKQTAEITGKMPHEVLREIGETGQMDGERVSATIRVDALKSAAPFYAPRLGTLDVSHKGAVAVNVFDPSMSFPELDRAAQVEVVRTLAFVSQITVRRQIENQGAAVSDADIAGMARRVLDAWTRPDQEAEIVPFPAPEPTEAGEQGRGLEDVRDG